MFGYFPIDELPAVGLKRSQCARLIMCGHVRSQNCGQAAFHERDTLEGSLAAARDIIHIGDDGGHAHFGARLQVSGMGLSICQSIIDAPRSPLWARVNEP
jgi:hypothetical protein